MNELSNISLKEFENLFRSNYESLCAHANGYLKDLEAAEEVVQSIFVKLWESRAELVITTSLASYLFTAVRNKCLNQLKHFKIRDAYKEQNKRELDDNYVTADMGMEANELEVRIMESINALPEGRKQIFMMSRYEGLKYKEIAEQLKISVKTVENQMGSAIKQLRMDLADYMVLLACIFFGIGG